MRRTNVPRLRIKSLGSLDSFMFGAFIGFKDACIHYFMFGYGVRIGSNGGVSD